jgi:hypothetical protein
VEAAVSWVEADTCSVEAENSSATDATSVVAPAIESMRTAMSRTFRPIAWKASRASRPRSPARAGGPA